MSKKEQENGWENRLGRSGINLEDGDAQSTGENFDIDKTLSTFLNKVSVTNGTDEELFNDIRANSYIFLGTITTPEVLVGPHLRKYPNLLVAFTTFFKKLEETANNNNLNFPEKLSKIRYELDDCKQEMVAPPLLAPIQKLITNFQDELTAFMSSGINTQVAQKLYQLAPKAFKNNSSLNDLKDEIKNIPNFLSTRTELIIKARDMVKNFDKATQFIMKQKSLESATQLVNQTIAPINTWKDEAEKQIEIISKYMATAANKHLGEPDIVEEVVTESAKTEDKKLSIANLDKIQSELSNLEKEYSEKIVNLLSKLYPKAFNESKGKPSLTHLKDDVCKTEGFKDQLDSFTAEINSQITTQLKNLKTRSEFVEKNPNIQAATKIIDLLEKNYTKWKAALEDKFNKTMVSLKGKLEIYFSEDNNNQHQQNLPEGKETVKEKSKQEISNTTPVFEDKAKIENDVLITGATEEVLEHYPES